MSQELPFEPSVNDQFHEVRSLRDAVGGSTPPCGLAPSSWHGLSILGRITPQITRDVTAITKRGTWSIFCLVPVRPIGSFGVVVSVGRQLMWHPIDHIHSLIKPLTRRLFATIDQFRSAAEIVG